MKTIYLLTIFAMVGISLPVYAQDALLITSVRAENVIGTAAQIKWITNLPADSKVYYGASANYNAYSELRCDGTGSVTSHCVYMTNLTPGTTYYYQVNSSNSTLALSAQSGGNVFVSASGTASTPTPTPTPISTPTPTSTPYYPTSTPTPTPFYTPTPTPYYPTPTPTPTTINYTPTPLPTVLTQPTPSPFITFSPTPTPFPTEARTKVITGLVKFSSGEAVTDAFMSIYSRDTSQTYKVYVDTSGKYTINVGGGTWQISIWPLNPAISVWQNQGESAEVTFYRDTSSEIKHVDATVSKTVSRLTITATDASGAPVVGAGINVSTLSAGQTGTIDQKNLSQYGKTDSTGSFTINLIPGNYYIRGFMPPESGYLNPSEQTIILTSNDNKTVNLIFKKKETSAALMIKGTTKLDNGNPADAFIWAWSEKGGSANTKASLDGSFALQVLGNDRWHIGAGKEFSGAAYKSSDITVSVGSTNVFVDIVLSKISEIRSVTTSGTATDQIVSQTSDGAKIIIPPNSVSGGGSLNVEVKPTIEAPSQPAGRIIGSAYDLTVKNSAGQEIKQFSQDLEINIPYNESEVAAQGLKEENLAPSYYDESTGTWVRSDNYTVDKERNIIVVRVRHLTRYAIVMAADIVPPEDVTGVSGIALNQGKIKLSWTNPTKDFSHDKIYRSELFGSLGLIAVSEVIGSEWTDENTSDGTTYYYTIRTVDPAGNESSVTKQIGIKAVGSSSAKPTIYGLNDGDIVSAAGSSDPDVYIVNLSGYKRLFLNPAIFAFYGHLGGFSKVKNITAETRDKFVTSGLFRNCETNDPKVYGVEVTGEDSGRLHWVNTTGEQAIKDDPAFFQRVFCINTKEFNWYAQSSAYNSVMEIPSYSR